MNGMSGIFRCSVPGCRETRQLRLPDYDERVWAGLAWRCDAHDAPTSTHAEVLAAFDRGNGAVGDA
jgi:hypothetical protein